MKSIKLTFGQQSKQKYWSKLEELEIDTVLHAFSEHETRNKKDGMCFVPAVMLVTPKENGVVRTASAVSEVTCLVYDIDGGQSLDEVKAIIEKHKFKCVAWTTHSHRSNTTFIKTDHYGSWAKRNNESRTPDDAAIKRYLKFAKKTHLKNVDFDVKRVIQSGEGTFWKLLHDPLDKVRVFFPLTHPIKFTDLSLETKVQQTVYKSIYHGVGETLGLVYDHACADPSRLHYTAAHKEGAEFWSQTYADDDWRLMDWTDMPRSAVLMEQASAEAHEDWSVTDKDGVTFNLLSWVKRNGASFDIAAVFREVLSEGMIRKDLSGGRDGFSVECPFEHEHGDTGGDGTYVETNVDTGFVFRCSHNSCKNAGRSRLHYLKQYIADGHLVAADLGIDVGNAPTTANTKVDAAKLLKDLDIDADTLPGGFIDEDEDEVEQPEDENVATSFTGAEAERDLREQIIAARGPQRAMNGITALRNAGVVLALDSISEMLAGSKLTMRDCHKVAAFAAAANPNWGLLKEDISVELQNKRYEMFPLSKAMDTLLEERRVGHELDTELQRLGLFYSKTKAEMMKAFKEQKLIRYRQENTNETLIEKEKAFIKRYAKCQVESKAYILDMDMTRLAGQQKLISADAMSTMNKSDTVFVEVPDGKGGMRTKEMTLFDYCLTKSPDFKKFDGFTFDPSPRAGRRSKLNEFNTWYGYQIRGKSGDASFINAHIKDVWCGAADEHTYEWVMTYLAHIFQRPWEKPGAGIVLGGPPGTGKSMPIEHGLGMMVDPYYGKSSDPEDICGKFTAYSCNKIIFLSEEAVWSGDKKMMRRLKDRVTSKTAKWEQKMLPRVEVPDFVRLFFTSNDAHVFDLEGEDRRYCILDTTTVHQNDLKYFGKMKDWLDEGGREIWYKFLMEYTPKVPFSELRNPPLTAARLRQVSMSRTPAAEFFVDLIKHGKLTTLPRDVDTDVQLAWPLDKEFVIKGEKLRIVFDQYIRYFVGAHFRYERGTFPAMFVKFLGREYATFIKQREDPDRPADKRARCLVLPPRQEVLEAQLKKPKPEFTDDDLQWAKDNPGSHAEQ